MTISKIPFTAEGFAKLENDLAELRARREPTVLRLQAAREMGDLSENGAYKAARFELSDIDRNIRRLTHLIKNAIVTTPTGTSKVGFGNTVTLEHANKQFSYQLVSRYESDPMKNRLSVESPLGLALIGHTVGDSVEIDAPAGRMKYQIITIA